MPIFTTQLGRLEAGDPAAVQRLANHIRYLQETLEYTLMNLDSTNITEIETDKTDIKSSDGGAVFSGSGLTLAGSSGENFTAGMVDGTFRFVLKGRNGQPLLYLTDGGQLVIPETAAVSVDGGEW